MGRRSIRVRKDWKPRSEWGKRLLADEEQKGLAKGRVGSILDVLEARGLELAPPLRQRITACTDPDLLGRWLRRAATATSAEEVFAS